MKRIPHSCANGEGLGQVCAGIEVSELELAGLLFGSHPQRSIITFILLLFIASPRFEVLMSPPGFLRAADAFESS